MTEFPLPGVQSFPGVMERTIQLVGSNVPRSNLQRVAEVLHTLRWDFRDYGLQIHFLVNDEGEVGYSNGWSGPVDSTISMDAATFHNAAFGKLNFGAALLMGKLRIEGISALDLGKFSSLLQPFLHSYRQACTEFYGPAG